VQKEKGLSTAVRELGHVVGTTHRERAGAWTQSYLCVEGRNAALCAVEFTLPRLTTLLQPPYTTCLVRTLAAS